MKKNITSQSKTYLFYILGMLLFTFTSCSTYKTTSSDDDGIYTSDTQVVTNKNTNSKADKYEKYFKSKADKINIEEDEVFTDVDGYSSDVDEDEEALERDADDFDYHQNSWEDTNEVTVNVYNYGGYYPYRNWYYNYYNPYYYSPYYSSWYFGYTPWYYGGYYNSWYGYYSPYYNSYYNNVYYNNYVYGRRSSTRYQTYNSLPSTTYNRNSARSADITSRVARTSTRTSTARTYTNTTRSTSVNRKTRISRDTNLRSTDRSTRVSRSINNDSNRSQRTYRKSSSSSNRSYTPSRSSSSRSTSTRSSSSSKSSRSSRR